MAERRELRFDSLDDVAQDVGTLLQQGYTEAGNWNLSQVCGHLDQWMGFAMDGYPKPSFPINLMLWLMKVTVAKKQLAGILESGFKPGGHTMPQTVSAANEVQDELAVDAFNQTVARFREYNGEMQPSPLFGQLDRSAAERLQLAHCAHHLSYLMPNQ